MRAEPPTIPRRINTVAVAFSFPINTRFLQFFRALLPRDLLKWITLIMAMNEDNAIQAEKYIEP